MVAFAFKTVRGSRGCGRCKKLGDKNPNLIVLNGPAAVGAADTTVKIIDRSGSVVGQFAGSKLEVARAIFRVLDEKLIRPTAKRG